MDQYEAEKRQMKDVLSTYNIMAEKCFNHCAKDFNYRILTEEEKSCVDRCSRKLININHRLVMEYGMKMAAMQDKAIKEAEQANTVTQETQQAPAASPKGDQTSLANQVVDVSNSEGSTEQLSAASDNVSKVGRSGDSVATAKQSTDEGNSEGR